jgi:hypothetical protein
MLKVKTKNNKKEKNLPKELNKLRACSSFNQTWILSTLPSDK